MSDVPEPMTEATLNLVAGTPGFDDPATLEGREFIGAVDNRPYTLVKVTSLEALGDGSKAVTYEVALEDEQ